MPMKIDSKKEVVITVAMNETQAYAFAQFLKRGCSFSTFRPFACDDEDAYSMESAGYCITEALSEAGVSPA
jgi:hypothetical protein